MAIRTISLALGVVFAGIAMPVLANIDTTGSDIGTINAFGSPNTATYGQTFTPTMGSTSLTGFSLFLRTREGGAGTLDLRGYVATWDGVQAGTLLYSSPTVTMNANGDLQQFSFATSVTVSSAQQYVAFLSVSDLGELPDSTFGMPFGTDSIPGAFVFQNNGTDFASLFSSAWDQGFVGDDDVFFTATFGAVPEPATWTLMISGFGMVGLAVRRRRSAVA